LAKSGKSKKQLTFEDREIWGRITNTAEPLPSNEKNYSNSFLEEFEADLQKQSLRQSVTKLQSSSAPVFRPFAQKKPELSTEYLDIRTTRKISKGKISIDGRLDLHGYHQHDAHHILYNYVENAYFSGKRTLLIITGKGNLGRGVLRENVPKWLAGAKFRLLISGFAESHSVHGGAGAIYIKIRRKR
jgi:DNA-nicking Smr family endonuclease